MAEISECKGCKAEIYWLKNIESGKAHPVNVEPDNEKGAIVILDNNTHFRILTKEALRMYRASGGELHTSHFSDCPNAPSFRKK